MASLLENSVMASSVAAFRLRKLTMLPWDFCWFSVRLVREKVQQAVVFQVLVHVERVQRFAVEARQEHVHHQQNVHLPVADALGHVLVVVVERLAVLGRVAAPVELVVVGDVFVQLLAGMHVDGRVAVDVQVLVRNAAVGVLILFVVGEGEDRGDPEVVRPLRLAGLEEVVVGDQGVDAADAEHRRENAAVGFAVVVGNDVVHDFTQALRAFQQLFPVDVLYFDVNEVAAIFALPVAAHVLDGEFEDVLVLDGVGDDVLVQAFVKD